MVAYVCCPTASLLINFQWLEIKNNKKYLEHKPTSTQNAKEEMPLNPISKCWGEICYLPFAK